MECGEKGCREGLGLAGWMEAALRGARCQAGSLLPQGTVHPLQAPSYWWATRRRRDAWGKGI